MIAFERATDLEPRPPANFTRAQALIAAGKYGPAIEILEPLSKTAPQPQVCQQNTRGIGVWITAETATGSQVREIHAGNNYVSQNPPEAHFGVGEATSVDVIVRWPDSSETLRAGVTAD